ncbi:hypothetical protein [Xenophilus sp. Marseille-Q4582]|uniref:hypothetical protein n=1 Tax=Xenophilus sp. Marseille-Q4582 TaxID=2866600 RepID=UPI001CE4483E|nr:hypothetical protein [Xenophilus sp. Marseille-Q4582]
MTIDLNDDDLRGLSAAEREALLQAAEDDADGDIAEAFGKTAGTAAEAPAPAAPGGDEAETDAEEDAAAAAAAATAATAAPAAPALAPAAEPAPAPAPEAPEEPAPTAPRATPDDIEDQRKALNAREDESLQKLMDGEITPEEHGKVKAEVRAGLDKLLLAEATDRAAAEADMRVMVRQYATDRASTAKDAKAAGLDYSPTSDAGKEFDGLVAMFSKELLGRGIADTPGNLANSKEALRQAHQVMLMRHGKAASAAPAAPAAAPVPAKGPRPPVNRSELPTTLANTPAAADASVAGNKFAHLDAIENPAELERALARLTPAEQEEYLGA